MRTDWIRVYWFDFQECFHPLLIIAGTKCTGCTKLILHTKLWLRLVSYLRHMYICTQIHVLTCTKCLPVLQGFWPADLLASYIYKYSEIKWKEWHPVDNSLLNPNPIPLKKPNAVLFFSLDPYSDLCNCCVSEQRKLLNQKRTQTRTPQNAYPVGAKHCQYRLYL